MRILPSVVTTNNFHTNQLKELGKLNLKEICVFLTCLSKKERSKFYKYLECSSLKRIPFVHLRSDMEVKELDFFAKRFKTNLFNIHPLSLFPLENDLSKYKEMILIENSDVVLAEKDLEKFAGICLDFTHLESDRRLNNGKYQKNIQMLKKFPCKFGHISAIRNILNLDEKTGKLQYDFHRVNNFSELDYLERYYQIFPPLVTLELENGLEEQLKIIDYLSSKTWASKT